MDLTENDKRPSEKAEKFLVEYLRQHPHEKGDRLPSTRNIARRLGISEGTVRNVVRKWQSEGKLQPRHGSGVFISEAAPGYPIRIGANVHSQLSPSTSTWVTKIHEYILKQIVELGPKASYSSLYSSSEDIDNLSPQEVESRCQGLDGMILIQGDSHFRRLHAYCQQHRKPYVILNAPSHTHTTNFISAASHPAFYKLGQALLRSGRQKIALQTHPDVQKSESMAARLSGLVNGIGAELSRSVSLRLLLSRNWKLESTADTLARLFDEEGYQPDAILFAGDEPALEALDFLNKRKIKVPEQISVISGSGAMVQERGITTLVHPVAEMGCALVNMLIQIIEKQTLEVPGRYLPIGIRTGNTTTIEESRLLNELFTTVT